MYVSCRLLTACSRFHHQNFKTTNVVCMNTAVCVHREVNLTPKDGIDPPPFSITMHHTPPRASNPPTPLVKEQSESRPPPPSPTLRASVYVLMFDLTYEGFDEAPTPPPAPYGLPIFARVTIMWEHGGLWLDDKIILTDHFSTFVDVQIDVIVLPLDMWGGHVDFGHAVQTSIMWSAPRHPIWLNIIKLIVKNVQDRYYGKNPWSAIYDSFYFGMMDYTSAADTGVPNATRLPCDDSTPQNYHVSLPRRDLMNWHERWPGAPLKSCQESLPPG